MEGREKDRQRKRETKIEGNRREDAERGGSSKERQKRKEMGRDKEGESMKE
jgi:hypothetical protein